MGMATNQWILCPYTRAPTRLPSDLHGQIFAYTWYDTISGYLRLQGFPVECLGDRRFLILDFQ